MKTIQPDPFKRLLIDVLSRRKPRSLAAHNLQRAGVLVPIIRAEGSYKFLFTKRTESVETHKGQVSFPGGVVDGSDKDIVDTALREAWEEVGIARDSVETIGILDDLKTPTGFVITPVVGVIEHLPELSVNTDEVAEVFQVAVEFFADPANVRKELRWVGGTQREVWFYDVDKHVIWGATAMVIRSFLQTIGMVQSG